MAMERKWHEKRRSVKRYLPSTKKASRLPTIKSPRPPNDETSEKSELADQACVTFIESPEILGNVGNQGYSGSASSTTTSSSNNSALSQSSPTNARRNYFRQSSSRNLRNSMSVLTQSAPDEETKRDSISSSDSVNVSSTDPSPPVAHRPTPPNKSRAKRESYRVNPKASSMPRIGKIEVIRYKNLEPVESSCEDVLSRYGPPISLKNSSPASETCKEELLTLSEVKEKETPRDSLTCSEVKETTRDFLSSPGASSSLSQTKIIITEHTEDNSLPSPLRVSRPAAASLTDSDSRTGSPRAGRGRSTEKARPSPRELRRKTSQSRDRKSPVPDNNDSVEVALAILKSSSENISQSESTPSRKKQSPRKSSSRKSSPRQDPSSDINLLIETLATFDEPEKERSRSRSKSRHRTETTAEPNDESKVIKKLIKQLESNAVDAQLEEGLELLTDFEGQ